MSRKQLIWARDDDDDTPRLAWRDEYTDGEDAGDVPLESLADLCDLEAEAANAHDFVGCHRMLAALLVDQAGRAVATEILREIAEMGGLHGMNGVCSDEDAFAELGVERPWKD